LGMASLRKGLEEYISKSSIRKLTVASYETNFFI